MIYLMGEMTNGSYKLGDTYPRGMGRCYVDGRLDPFADEPWILDNGVFREWNANGRDIATDYTRRYAHFESKLPAVASLVQQGRGPLFVVAPDRPGDPASLDVTLEWLDRWEPWLKEHQVPVYAALQDGMTLGAVEASGLLWRVQGLFLGGTDAFKEMSNVLLWRAFIHWRGIKLHFGRCTQSRMAMAKAARCDSADSSHPNRLSGRRWERFLEVFDEVAA